MVRRFFLQGDETVTSLFASVIRNKVLSWYLKPLHEQGAADMIDKELLEILCCPETKQDLTLIQGTTINRLNDLIKEGKLTNRAGETVKEPMDAGLLREDKKFLYMIREDIPIMLIDQAIPYDESFSS
jgi:uncharacterized protein YbaR (Trm112 family)